MHNGSKRKESGKGKSGNRMRTESFYENLEESEFNSQIIEIEADTQKYDKIELLPAQKFIIEEAFIIKDNESKLDTELFLTNYRIIVIQQNPISIPYGYIQNITLNEQSMKLQLKTGFSFAVNAERDHNDLKAYIDLGINQLPFCMFSLAGYEKPCIYDSWAEVERMRVDNKQYKVFKNTHLKFCASYPLHFLVPKNIQVDNLQEVKKCRYSGRIPVMTFYHEKTQVGIWRAAKPYKDLNKESMKYDIAYLKEISKDLIIIELETSSTFKNFLTFQTLRSVKIHFQSFVQAYIQSITSPPTSKTETFLKSLGRWYEEVDKLISISYHVVSLIQKGKHVLLEETYALDRISQVVSLASIILDPFYRTFKGFGILIEKEFICFGHPFETRCGFNKNLMEESSPIFIQFLECVHQMAVAHPESFQFSSSYLAKIGYEVFTTKYRNFLDRTANTNKAAEINKCQFSIWDKSARERCHHNFQFNRALHDKELWEIRKKPSLKQFMIWVEYFDAVCKMSFEKKTRGQPLKESRRLTKYLSEKQQLK